MDPLSTLASLIAVAQISGTIISYCYEYRKSVRNAPQDLNRVLNEVTSLRDIVERLMKLVDDDETTKRGYFLTLEQMIGENGPFFQCQAELERLKNQLERPINQWKALGRRLIWPLQERSVMKSLETIRQIKNIIESALLVDNSVSIVSIRDTARDLKEKLSDFRTSSELRLILDWLNAADQSFKYNQALEKREENTGNWFLTRSDYKSWKETSGLSFWIHGIPGCGKTVLCSTIIEDVVRSGPPDMTVAYYYFDFGNKSCGTVDGLLRSLISQISSQVPRAPLLLKGLMKVYNFNLENQWPWVERESPAAPQPSVKQLTALLLDIIEKLEDVYIIIDALDECTELQKVLQLLEKMIERRESSIHLLFTSRSEQGIKEAIVPIVTSQVLVESFFITEDIRSFIRNKLKNDRKLRKWPQKVRDEIEAKLIGGAHGMFRWVDCQIQALRECIMVKDLRETLAGLPETLTATYARVLENINPRCYKYAMTVLKFLTISPRPVQLREAVDFLAVDLDALDGPQFDPEHRLPEAEDILNICSSLVTMSTVYTKYPDGSIKGAVQELRLAHFSVKEFLISQYLIPSPETCLQASIKEDWHAMVARCCLAYLVQFQNTFQEEDLQEYPLACYSAQYWILHMKSSAVKKLPEIEELALQLLSPSTQAYYNWGCLYDLDRPWRGVDLDNSSNGSRIPPPLYYASGAGLEGIVKRLLQTGSDPNSREGMFGSALQAACYYGHATIVKLLLSAGADVNICSGVFKNPLGTAVIRGHQEIARILLEKGAEPDSVSFEKGTSLLIACRSGNSEIVRQLLESGADPNICTLKSGGAPLAAATHMDHADIVSQLLPKTRENIILQCLESVSECSSREIIRLYFKYVPHWALDRAVELGWQDTVIELLDQGGPSSSIINSQVDDTESKASVLLSAATRGNESLVSQMIESGIDINEKCKIGNSMPDYALGCAAEEGHITIVKLLLKNKANLNAMTASGDALQRAAFYGHQAVVEMLLQAGAKIDQIDGPYAGALQAAVMGRHTSVAKFLLENGANVNAQRRTKEYWRRVGNYGTALQAAVGQGDTEITQYLLSAGADVNTASKIFKSPLSKAASLGSEILLKLLLEAGANTDLDDGRKGTPIFRAIRHKILRSMEILIKSGASVNIVCRQKSCKLTPLAAAILNNYEEGVKVLLESGADVTVTSEFNNGWEPPLHTAARVGYAPIARMLLDYGADANRQIEGGWTALHYAARNGNEGVLRLLVVEYQANMSLRLANGGLCLHSAATSKSPEQLKVIEALLQLGADINGSNHMGRTALHWAVEEERVSAVRLLLQKGANASLCDWEANISPADIARMKLSEKPNSKPTKEIIEMLESGVAPYDRTSQFPDLDSDGGDVSNQRRFLAGA